MNFLVQTINKCYVYDFAFELTRSRDYYDWMGEKLTLRKCEDIDFDKIKNPDRYVPVGSVQFVSAYLNKFYPEAKKGLEPLNVPEVLFPFAGRTIANIHTPDDLKLFNDCPDVYVKSLTTIKDSKNGGVLPWEHDKYVGFQMSSFIDIISEWRVFVFKGEILDCRCYLGDFFTYPDPKTVMTMVQEYKNAPRAYTLDVAVTSKGETVVLECHRFFSCGLYGFSMPHIYPAMLSQTWFEMKNLK